MEQKNNSATWIWYPGDLEIWLGNQFNNRRTERGAMFPPFWKQDSHYVTVEFSTEVSVSEPETVSIACEGRYNLMLDGKLQFGEPQQFTVPSGRHKLNIKVWNQLTPPALYVCGPTIKTSSSWLATYEDKIWIDENGVAHGSGIYVPAASWCFDSPDTPPSTYHLERREQQPVSSTPQPQGGTLYDFGRETFGYLKVAGLQGTLYIYYGESREEALDREHCETLDVISEGKASGSASATLGSKAFRYVYVVPADGSSYDAIDMDYEFSPHDTALSGSFRCSDQLLNDIWQTAAYTMDLTTREFFLDGIKRDRWTWSGDAIQSYLMNYYLRFDTECVKRTIRQLRGKDPVTAHVNTIMDYTFYWMISVGQYYQYTGDVDFLREIYPRMLSLFNYCMKRADGFDTSYMMEGKDDDWIFVDWVDFPMHKRGKLCFEQILLCKAEWTLHECAAVLAANPLDNAPQGSLTTEQYAEQADMFEYFAKHLQAETIIKFWDSDSCAFLHAIEDGEMNRQITKFPNMFAILYDMLDADRQQEIMKSVMLNASVPAITTPYMRFYELEALCMMGQHEYVLGEIRDYWGGMLREGATTFWEKYVPTEHGVQHLAMYGRPYGKSLCHAWGASPVYLLGKYFLGVSPLKPGYEEFEVCPSLGGLEWIEGAVPTPRGLIRVAVNDREVRVTAPDCSGWIVVGGRRVPARANTETVVPLA